MVGLARDLKFPITSPWTGVVIALACTAAVVIVRIWLADLLDSTVPIFLLFTLSVVVSAYAGGFVPGMLALVLGVAVASYFFLEPVHSLWVIGTPNRIRIALFLIVGTSVSLLSEGLRRTQARLIAGSQRLRESEAFKGTILESALDALIVMDDQGRIVELNEAAERIFGYRRADAVGKTVAETLIPPRLRDAHWRGLRHYLVTGEGPVLGRRVEMPALRADGSEIPVELAIAVTRFGARVFFTAYLRGLTERLRAREALRESEGRFRLMADGAPVMIWLAGPDEQREWFNRQWLAFRGRTLELEAGRGWQEGLHPEDLERCIKGGAAAFAAREPFQIEYRLRRFDGQYRWVLENGVPRFGGGGQFEGFIGSAIDITERKEAEHEREELLASERYARSEADRLGRIKDEFLATLSHELRTPLSAILGWSSLLRGRTPKPEELAKGLETIDRNARVQARIIDDLLDMSRIVSGKVRLEVQRVDLSAVIEAALETVRPAARAKEIRMHSVLDSPAGPVTGDANRLQQVVWNLLSNAIKFTPRGGRLQVVLERVGSHAEIHVSDTGQGIKPEFLPHVFDRFRQADASTTRRHGGLGLGLSIVKHLVELHGGSVRASSPGEGQGATFSVTLPLSIVHPDETRGARAHSPLLRTAATLDSDVASIEGVKVLIVDDEPDARDFLERLLADRKAEVLLASDAQEGFRLLKSRRPDVVVSDIGMPDEDGYDFIRRVRSLRAEEGGRTPAIALTAYARVEDRTRSLIAGYQMHVAKPVEPAELIASIASLTDRSG
jgi:PAS domain S-box-containing protein